MFQMSATLMNEMWEDDLRARWKGGPTVLAFLFALPHSDVFHELDQHGDYLNIRSGNTWDLFWPGYYNSERDRKFEVECGAEPIGSAFASNWYFNAQEFNQMRRDIEEASADVGASLERPT